MNHRSSSKMFFQLVLMYLPPWFPEIPKFCYDLLTRVSFFCVGKVCLIFYFNLLISERERAMLFPDYYFLAERRLVNHNIETRKVKNLDDCELFCYPNDNCVSLNFKKDPGIHPKNDKPGHICELNNATHLKYDGDLTTDVLFYYRGSKVSYNQNLRICRLEITYKQ